MAAALQLQPGTGLRARAPAPSSLSAAQRAWIEDTIQFLIDVLDAADAPDSRPGILL